MTPTFLQGEVVFLDPLRIRLDGDDAAIDVTPEVACATALGDRVLCLLLGHQLIVLAVIGATSTGGAGLTGSVQFKATRAAGTVALPANAFVTYPLDTIDTNIGGGSYDTSTYIYTVPVAGLYLCLGGIRCKDSSAVMSVATGIGTTNADAPFVLWENMGSPSQRSGRQYTRLVNFAAGDQVRMFIYAAGASGVAFNTMTTGAAGQFMSLTRLA